MSIERAAKEGAFGAAEKARATPEGQREERNMRLAMAAYYERTGDKARAKECREMAGGGK